MLCKPSEIVLHNGGNYASLMECTDSQNKMRKNKYEP